MLDRWTARVTRAYLRDAVLTQRRYIQRLLTTARGPKLDEYLGSQASDDDRWRRQL